MGLILDNYLLVKILGFFVFSSSLSMCWSRIVVFVLSSLSMNSNSSKILPTSISPIIKKIFWRHSCFFGGF